jgi:hypothetical protein
MLSRVLALTSRAGNLVIEEVGTRAAFDTCQARSHMKVPDDACVVADRERGSKAVP